jgi:hypothetical protein
MHFTEGQTLRRFLEDGAHCLLPFLILQLLLLFKFAERIHINRLRSSSPAKRLESLLVLETLIMLYFLGINFSPALGAIALPGRVAIKATPIFAKEGGLINFNGLALC